jgi:hypothetical protein
MKLERKIIILSVLLLSSMMITPALASTTQAEFQTHVHNQNLDTTTIEIIDCTGGTPIKKQITLSKTELKTITTELHAIAQSTSTMIDQFTAQLSILKKHGLVSQDININTLLEKFNKKTHTILFQSLQHRFSQSMPINNTLFSALSAISFSLENENGSTLVFGLNTFINLIGFNIISLHKGYAPDGIQTNGLISGSVPPGEYTGFIFGFFGYWFGEKISTGVYTNLTCSGLGIITGWVELT